MKYMALALVAAATLASPALAADVVGTTAAVFVNPTPGTTVTGVGTSHFTTGLGTPNSLTFTGTPFSSAYETPFKVGTLSYFNGATTSGTAATSVDLSLKLAFTTPTLPDVTSVFPFNFVITPNLGINADDDADYLYFPSSYSTTQFVIDGTTYRVKLTGFQNIVGDGFLASDATQLHVREGLSATADLFAVVTTIAPSVPEPATWVMMIAGFGLAGSALRRKASATRLAII